MALSTNYKRNSDRDSKGTAARIAQAKALAQEFVAEFGTDPLVALGFASSVILKRTTVERVTEILRSQP